MVVSVDSGEHRDPLNWRKKAACCGDGACQGGAEKMPLIIPSSFTSETDSFFWFCPKCSRKNKVSNLICNADVCTYTRRRGSMDEDSISTFSDSSRSSCSSQSAITSTTMIGRRDEFFPETAVLAGLAEGAIAHNARKAKILKKADQLMLYISRVFYYFVVFNVVLLYGLHAVE